MSFLSVNDYIDMIYANDTKSLDTSKSKIDMYFKEKERKKEEKSKKTSSNTIDENTKILYLSPTAKSANAMKTKIKALLNILYNKYFSEEIDANHENFSKFMLKIKERIPGMYSNQPEYFTYTYFSTFIMKYENETKTKTEQKNHDFMKKFYESIVDMWPRYEAKSSDQIKKKEHNIEDTTFGKIFQ